MTAWHGAKGLVCRARCVCASVPEKGQSPGRAGCLCRAPQTHGDLCPPSVCHSWGQSWTPQRSALGVTGLQGPVYPEGRSPPGCQCPHSSGSSLEVVPGPRPCLNTHIRPPTNVQGANEGRQEGAHSCALALAPSLPAATRRPRHQESVLLGPHIPAFSWLRWLVRQQTQESGWAPWEASGRK